MIFKTVPRQLISFQFSPLTQVHLFLTARYILLNFISFAEEPEKERKFEVELLYFDMFFTNKL